MNRLLLLFSVFLFSASLYSQNQCPVWDWAKRSPSNNKTFVEALPTGDYFVAGELGNTINFGSTTASSIPSGWNSFIGKMDANGIGLWVKRLDNIDCFNILKTPGNGLLLAGSLIDTSIIGSDTLIPSTANNAILKFDGLGTLQWAQNIDSTSIYDIAVDNDGNILISGSTNAFRIGNLSTNNNKGFIAKLDQLGNWKWVTTSGNYQIINVEATINGSIYSTYYAQGATTLGTLNLATAGTYLTVLDSNGVWQKATKTAASSYNSSYLHIIEDNLGNCLVHSSANSFISKYNLAGQLLWSNTISADFINAGQYDPFPNTIHSADKNGNIYLLVLSDYNATTIFGQDSVELRKGPSSTDICLAKLNSSGQFEWAGTIGSWWNWGASGTNLDRGTDISVISHDTVLVSGWVGANTTVGLDSIKRGNFLARYIPAPSVTYSSYSDTIHCGDSLRLTVPTNSVAELYHTWSPATDMTDSTSSYPIVSPKSTTTYYVQAFNSNGCGDSAQVTVYVNPYINGPGLTNFVPSTGNFYYCDNGYSVNIPTPGFTNFKWSNGDTTSTLYPNKPGVYSCTYENLNGCLVTDSFDIFPIAEVRSIVQHNLLCLGDTQTLYNFLPVDSVRWNTGSTKDSITVTSAGTYWMEAWKDGCHYTDSMQIDQFTDTANADFTYHIKGDTVTFTPASIGVAKALWSFGDGWYDNVISPTHRYLKKDTFEVCLEILDVCGYRDTVCKMLNLNDVGLNEADLSSSLKIFPNPAENILNIHCTNSFINEHIGIPILITDIRGKHITNLMLNRSREMEVDISNLSPGVYTIQIGSIRRKLLKR